MARSDRPLEPVHVACEVCLREVPPSEAQVSEAADYVAYFCGIECYELWKKKSDEALRESGERAGPARPVGGKER